MGDSFSKSKEKLLFLDVDGVLNSMDNGDGDTIEDSKVLLLKTIIDKTGAKIVISSSWRLIDRDLKELTTVLHKYNMDYIGIII